MQSTARPRSIYCFECLCGLEISSESTQTECPWCHRYIRTGATDSPATKRATYGETFSSSRASGGWSASEILLMRSLAVCAAVSSVFSEGITHFIRAAFSLPGEVFEARLFARRLSALRLAPVRE